MEVFIIGSNNIGSIVEASLSNTSVVSADYQWQRSSIYNGDYEDIENATFSTYKIGISDLYIKCKVTISGTNYYSNVLVINPMSSTNYTDQYNSEIDAIGKGLKYSELISKVSGKSNIIYDLSRINQSIKIILSTALGEVPMIPTLGCRLHEMLFEGATDQLEGQIKLEIEKALSDQEPRIIVTEVTTFYDEIHTISAKVSYVVRNTNIKSQYIYEVEVREGGTEVG